MAWVGPVGLADAAPALVLVVCSVPLFLSVTVEVNWSVHWTAAAEASDAGSVVSCSDVDVTCFVADGAHHEDAAEAFWFGVLAFAFEPWFGAISDFCHFNIPRRAWVRARRFRGYLSSPVIPDNSIWFAPPGGGMGSVSRGDVVWIERAAAVV